MSAKVRCDICGKEADYYGMSGFAKLSFMVGEPLENKSVDLCWEHSQAMLKAMLNWVEKMKNNFKKAE